MPIQLYNTLNRKKEKFEPIKNGSVGLYTCGPTVYNFAHIGNLRTYIFEDILRRTLEYAGFQVRHVMNITDVGHLTSDADEGEDKLEKTARTLEDVRSVIKKYTTAFFDDLRALNIEEPHVIAPASEHIAEQQAIIRELLRKGFAYETTQAVYFDVSRLSNYGKLTGQSLETQRVGAREGVVADQEKRNVQDFALWFKRIGRFANHIQYWPSPWGDGFPGWHIECSAISTEFLGQPFDIHTGGVDHIGTHHTNEIAQSEAAADGKPLAHYWVHGEHLNLENTKMAKSGENFITLSAVAEKGFTPMDFRYYMLSAKYRTPMQFSWDALGSAQTSLKRVYDQIDRLLIESSDFKKYDLSSDDMDTLSAEHGEFLERAAGDDLNIPAGLNLLHEVLFTAYAPALKLRIADDFDRVLGLKLLDPGRLQRALDIPDEVAKLVEEREKARQGNNWERADEIRQEIDAAGWLVEDTPKGPILHKR